MRKQYYTYIATNKRNTVLYTGVTNDLHKRMYEHKNKLVEGFSKKYNINKLVYYETFNDIYVAISREKQIKNLVRRKKIELIKSLNSEWKDLIDDECHSGAKYLSFWSEAIESRGKQLLPRDPIGRSPKATSLQDDNAL